MQIVGRWTTQTSPSVLLEIGLMHIASATWEGNGKHDSREADISLEVTAPIPRLHSGSFTLGHSL